MKDTIGLLFSNCTMAEQEIIMAGLLNIFEIEGFEQKETDLLAYIAKNDFQPGVLEDWCRQHNLICTVNNIEEQNWNALWESNFEPVVVKEFCGIRANFHPPFENVQYDLIITPKMSFGTGHHATTFQVVAAMESIDFKNKKVCDFGTGTGVLAILAEKLGAITIDAIDNDDWSIENAKENIKVNYCININCIQAQQITNNEYDIILANINKSVLLLQMASIKNALKHKGILILSGILKEDRQDMEASLILNNLIINRVTEKDHWLCIWAENT